MTEEQLIVHSKTKDYFVHFLDKRSIVAKIKEKSARRKIHVLVDARIIELHKDLADSLVNMQVYVLEAKEENKTLDMAVQLYESLLKNECRRADLVIAIGGGIVQDLAGFVTSTIHRGLPWIFVPTTLLAQSDSCIGGKTSLNFKQYKNILGNFYPPDQIWLAVDFLETLDTSAFLSGIGEVAKLHIMGSETERNWLIQNLTGLLERQPSLVEQSIKTSLNVKLPYIEQDEYDEGPRKLLNYGHCIGHAIESATSYAIPHGQAISVGMLLANRIAMTRGELSASREQALRTDILSKILCGGLDVLYSMAEEIAFGMLRDKKRIGTGLALVVPCSDQSFKILTDVSQTEVIDAVKNEQFYC